ncbi:hypothetical protein [Pseudoalteromonas sp. RB2-MNA-CIBAN-0110]|uniref:hypothetical protein n=1 Tax=Pseudoalteromonas sp. RB2-MNA-CIBAN-0110 TaxID=3140439 RepID=UPI00332194C2
MPHFGKVKLDEREVNSHLRVCIVGEALYLTFGKVKSHEREVNSHLQCIVGEVLYLALVKLS